MPRGQGLEVGLHRLSLSVEDWEGDVALHAAAWPHLLDPEDEDFEEVTETEEEEPDAVFAFPPLTDE